jgi:hypothetical protein
MYPCLSRPEAAGILPGIFLITLSYDIVLTYGLIVQHTDDENCCLHGLQIGQVRVGAAVEDGAAQFDSSVVLASVLFGSRAIMCEVMLMLSVLKRLERIPSRLNLKHWKAFSFVNNGTFLIEFSSRMRLLSVSNQRL